jgi:hypothetical protein
MKMEQPAKESKKERLARFGRNINALGALAIGGVALAIPGPNAVLAGLAALDVVQAGGFEMYRQHVKKKRSKTS